MGRDWDNERHRDNKKSQKRNREDDKKSRSSRNSRNDVRNVDESDKQRSDNGRNDVDDERRLKKSKKRVREVDDDNSDSGSYKKDRSRKSSKSGHRSRDKRDKKRSKKKKHRRRDESSDDDSNDRKSRKKMKKSRSSEHSNDDEINRKSLDNQILNIPATLNVDKNILFPIGAPIGRIPDKILDVEKDYFEYHQHFWLFLYRNKQIAFNDLTNDQARSLFADFVKQYNEGILESGYYDTNGPPQEALNEIKTSRHKWGFQISDRENEALQTLQVGIRKQTEYSNQSETLSTTTAVTATRTNTLHPTNESNLLKTINDEDNNRNNETGPTNKSYRRSSKQERKEHIDNIDDMMGRKDGRERIIEKRKEVGAKIHGASKDREDTTFAPVISDDVLYGDTTSDFQAAVASQKQRKMKHVQQQQARIVELQTKEEDKQKAMLQLLGLADKIKTGDKIKIQPRND